MSLQLPTNCDSNFRLLSLVLPRGLSSSANTLPTVKIACQRLHFVRTLKKNNMEMRLLISFYFASVESVSTCSMSVWYVGCAEADIKALQRVVRAVEKILGCQLPPQENVTNSCYITVHDIVKNSSYPDHHLFK